MALHGTCCAGTEFGFQAKAEVPCTYGELCCGFNDATRSQLTTRILSAEWLSMVLKSKSKFFYLVGPSLLKPRPCDINSLKSPLPSLKRPKPHLGLDF